MTEFEKGEAYRKYKELDNGIFALFTAAEIYAIHVISNLRDKKPDYDLINVILTQKRISGFSVIGDSYKKNEIEDLRNNASFKHVGQQILVAIHTALEAYLIDKFKEIFFYISKDEEYLKKIYLKKVSFRDLGEINNNYKNYLNINLSAFEIDFYTTNNSNFQPQSCWEAVNLIFRERHSIVHSGKLKDYQITTLTDAWYPFEFTFRWVEFFETNFNLRIYENRNTKYLQKYDNNVNKIRISNQNLNETQ